MKEVTGQKKKKKKKKDGKIAWLDFMAYQPW